MDTIKIIKNGNTCEPETPISKYARVISDGTNFYCTNQKNDLDFDNKQAQILAACNQDEPAPRNVAAWKVKSILKIQGLYNTIEAALNQLEEPNKTIANMAWQHAESINQFSPTVQLIKQTCQLSDEQIQAIFDSAEAINI